MANTGDVQSVINSLWGFLSVVVVVLGALLAVYLILRHGRIKFRDAELSGRDLVSDNQQPTPALPSPAEVVSPHSTCPHASDIMEVARRTTALGTDKAALKVASFNEQVKIYEEQSEKMMEKFRHTMIKLLDTKTDGAIPFLLHPDYRIFENILCRIEAELRVYVTARFTENHYDSYDVSGQLRYVEDKVHIVLTKLTSKLNMYWCCQTVSRADVYDTNKADISDYAQIIEAVFTEAFAIARARADKEKALDAEYEAFLQGTVGGNV